MLLRIRAKKQTSEIEQIFEMNASEDISSLYSYLKSENYEILVDQVNIGYLADEAYEMLSFADLLVFGG